MVLFVLVVKIVAEEVVFLLVLPLLLFLVVLLLWVVMVVVILVRVPVRNVLQVRAMVRVVLLRASLTATLNNVAVMVVVVAVDPVRSWGNRVRTGIGVVPATCSKPALSGITQYCTGAR